MDLSDEDIAAPRLSDDRPQIQRSAPREATYLGAFDVFSLIVNKMIGTGIYTAPTTVLLLTSSKQVSLALWAVGFVYTVMSMIVYLDYAAVFPYTGGEIVYLDEITSSNEAHPPLPSITTAPLSKPNHQGPQQSSFPNGNGNGNGAPAQGPHNPPRQRQGLISRLLGDGLLAYTVYAFLFVAIFNSCTNILQIGRQTLIAISPGSPPNADLMRFISVFALSIICFIQLFSSRAGRALNNFSSILKLLFLIVLLGFGFDSLRRNGSAGDFTDKVPSKVDNFSYAQALLIVLYSYEGWENATFVAGEIDTEDPGTLRKGFIWAVCVVGLLYMLLNVVFLCAIPYVDVVALRDTNQQFNYAAMFSGNVTSARRGWAIVIAISSAGNANTVTYTFTRVKQSIGRMNILPWSSLWQADYMPHRHEDGDRHRTPLGGLLLEWVDTVVLIAASAAIPALAESVNMPGNTQTIAHCFILMFLGVGLLRLRSREQHLGVVVEPSWFPRVSQWGIRSLLGKINQIWFTIVYVGLNAFIFIVTALSNSFGTDKQTYAFPGKYYPTIVMALAGLGVVYYWAFFAAYVPNPLWKPNLLQIANVTCEIKKDDSFDLENELARRFGQRRSITIVLEYMDIRWKAWIYWFFGGEVDNSPVTIVHDMWTSCKRTMSTAVYAVETFFSLSRRASEEESPQGSEMGDIELSSRATHEH